jgi:hypothetical protein
LDISTLWLPLIMIGVVVYGLTEGLKTLIPKLADTWRGVAVRAIPTVAGMVFGVVPGVFPQETPFGMALLLGGAAGVFCAFAYETVTTAINKKKGATDGGQ